MRGWLKAGQVKFRETIHDGIAEAPAALIGLMAGENCGKMLVRPASELRPHDKAVSFRRARWVLRV